MYKSLFHFRIKCQYWFSRGDNFPCYYCSQYLCNTYWYSFFSRKFCVILRNFLIYSRIIHFPLQKWAQYTVGIIFKWLYILLKIVPLLISRSKPLKGRSIFMLVVILTNISFSQIVITLALCSVIFFIITTPFYLTSIKLTLTCPADHRPVPTHQQCCHTEGTRLVSLKPDLLRNWNKNIHTCRV